MMRGAPIGSLVSVAISAAVALGACDSGVDAPLPGAFLVEVTSDTGPPGGAIVSLKGDFLELIPESGRLFQRSTSGGLRIAIVGTDGETLRFRARVADSSRPPTGTVEDVVSFANDPISTSPYRVTVTPVP